MLRALWSAEAITYKGRWHTIDNAGINPLPVQRPIPIWIGGGSEQAIARVGRIGDGWFPLLAPGDAARAALARLRGYARDAERDPGAIGVAPQLVLGQVGHAAAADHAAGWRDLGATHLAINTQGVGYDSAREQIAALRAIKDLLRPVVPLAAPAPR